ncbi:hypothetical protein I4U23_030904 [Adineta vaga]|nr:hypothetical protein I4U23_030904 [Adineta vaga]
MFDLVQSSLLFLLFFVVQGVAAGMGAMDVIALILGLAMLIFGSASSTRQVHTILGGGLRYETAELILSTIPNFELKQKGRILQLFSEVRNENVDQ